MSNKKAALPSQRLVEYHADDGARTAIVHKGRNWLYAVTIGYPVSVSKLPLSAEEHMKPITDYPLEKAKAKYRKAGKRLGVTKAAKRLLRKAAPKAAPVAEAAA